MHGCGNGLRCGLLRSKHIRMVLCVLPVLLVMTGSAVSQMKYKIPPPTVYRPFDLKGRGGWTDGKLGGGYVKPDPEFKPSYLPDGQVDIQGTWGITGVGTDIKGSIEALGPNDRSNEGSKVFRPGRGNEPIISRVVDPVDGVIPYKPWARKLRDELDVTYIDSQSTCVRNVIPRQMSYQPNRIIQFPDKILILSTAYQHRHVYLDGRPHPAQNVKMYVGDSRGKWEGTTLVTDVTNFNDKTNFSLRGDYHSDQLHVMEHFTPIAKNLMQYEGAIEDPVVFDRPWTVAWPLVSRAGRPGDIDFELYCAEGNLSTIAQIEGGLKLFKGLNEIIATRPDIKAAVGKK